MINERWANYYCCEDISKIENYEEAVNDKTQVWDIHHRAEITQDGVRSKQELIKNGLYWHVPAAQLIFLTKVEHRRLHHKGNTYCLGKHHTDETRNKMSAVRKGVPKSEEHKQNIAAAHKGVPLSEEHKQKLSGSLKGRQLSEEHKHNIGAAWKGMKYWNNGQINVRAKECPPGFVPGRLKNGGQYESSTRSNR